MPASVHTSRLALLANSVRDAERLANEALALLINGDRDQAQATLAAAYEHMQRAADLLALFQRDG